MTSAPPRLTASFVFIASCCVLFLLCVAFRLNGSSSAFWAQDLQSNEPTGLLLGQPRLTRSDEWLVWTPAALSQLHQRPPMPVRNYSLGAGVSPLLMSVPVRHYTMFFRPQFWGFFVFDAEGGFSWFWCSRLFALLISAFLLFRFLLGGRVLLAICASLALTYSSLLQWFFSSPTMLPDMIATWAVMLLAGKSSFDARPLWKKFLVAILFAGSAVNFVLCCYPPFEIPLLYLAFTLFAAFLWQRRHCSFHGGFFWLGGATLLAILALWPWFLECRSTLEVIAHTSYPGARRGHGGTMQVPQLLSGLLNFFDGNRPHSALFPNTSEASNIFPIWIPALVSLSLGWRRERRLPAVQLALALFILACVGYSLVGMPEWFCRLTALSFVTEKRALLALGLAGFMLCFLSLRRDGKSLVEGRARFLALVAVGLGTAAYFFWLRPLDSTLTPKYLAALIATTALLYGLYFCARPMVFAAVFAGAILLNNFLVNPIATGLPILLESKAAQQVAAIHEADPGALWAAYERNTFAQFGQAQGARFLNGVKTVPDLALLEKLEDSEESRTIYNRYALIALNLPPPGEEQARFEPTRGGGDGFRLLVNPWHPVLRAAGLRYAVFPRLLREEERGPMRLIDALPANFIYIYQVETLPVK